MVVVVAYAEMKTAVLEHLLSLYLSCNGAIQLNCLTNTTD